MKGFVPPDPETSVSTESIAVVYAPRRKRPRYPASCVRVVLSQEQALKEARPEQNYFAARVLGPSKSSEGQFIYYLLEWL